MDYFFNTLYLFTNRYLNIDTVSKSMSDKSKKTRHLCISPEICNLGVPNN